jgi:hypothetical protein
MHFKLAQKRIKKREGGGLQSSIFSGCADFSSAGRTASDTLRLQHQYRSCSLGSGSYP